MGSIVGFVLLTLLSYIFLVLKVPFLIIPTTLILLLLVAKPIIKEFKNIKVTLNLQTIVTLAVFIIGIAGQLAVISPSGVTKNGDMLFWSANGHDGAWHIALMEEFKRGFPFQNPVYAGERLVNYHFFSDILPGMISKYIPVSDQNLYFRIFPFFYSLFLGASVYFLTKKLTNSFAASIWATIFTYFAGSFGFIVTYIKNRSIGGESIFWATQPQSASGNPPQIVSDFLIITGLYYILKLSKKWSWTDSAILVLISGTISEFKIYAGVVLLIGLGIVGVWQGVKERAPNFLLTSIASGILAAILYFPNSTGSISFLVFQPWWYIRTMIVDPSRLNWIDLELRRQFYAARGGIRPILRIIEYEGVAFLIFFFGNLGMRFLGLTDFGKMTKKIFADYFNLAFISIAVVSLILPLLFLQKGVATNTAQFLQYFVLLMGIAAGISVAKLTNIFKFLIPIILILMVPTQIGLIIEFYGTPAHVRPAYAKIDSNELAALAFIKNNTNPNDIILTPPYDPNLNLKDSIPNIWDWFDTSYIAAFSGRRTYMDDYEQNDIMGYDYRKRLATKQKIFEGSDPNLFVQYLKSTKANLVYFPEILKPKINLATIGLTKIYSNSNAEVWKVN